MSPMRKGPILKPNACRARGEGDRWWWRGLPQREEAAVLRSPREPRERRPPPPAPRRSTARRRRRASRSRSCGCPRSQGNYRRGWAACRSSCPTPCTWRPCGRPAGEQTRGEVRWGADAEEGQARGGHAPSWCRARSRGGASRWRARRSGCPAEGGGRAEHQRTGQPHEQQHRHASGSAAAAAARVRGGRSGSGGGSGEHTITSSGRRVADAMASMSRADVFETRKAPGLQFCSSLPKICFLTPISSKTASTTCSEMRGVGRLGPGDCGFEEGIGTMSQWARSVYSSVPLSRERALSTDACARTGWWWRCWRWPWWSCCC